MQRGLTPRALPDLLITPSPYDTCAYDPCPNVAEAVPNVTLA